MKLNINILRVNKILSLVLFFCLLSCASHKYTKEQRNTNNTIKIYSDISGVSVDFAFATKNKKNLGYIDRDGFTYTYKKLRFWKTFLVLSGDHVETKTIKIWRVPRGKAIIQDTKLGIFTYFAPLVVDPILNPDFYKIAKFNREIEVKMKYKQKYMLEQFQRIEKSTDITKFKIYLLEYPDSECKQLVFNKIDSLELKTAENKRSVYAIDEFISAHESSKFLKEAEKIKNDYVNARSAFNNAKKDFSSESMAKFIKEYPKSLEYNEAIKIFVERVFAETIKKNTIKDALNFTENVLYICKHYLSTNEFEEYKRKITNNVDSLIVASAAKDKSYEVLKEFWLLYQDIENRYRYENRLGDFSLCKSFDKKHIYTTAYKKLVKLTSELDQTTFFNQFREDFKGLNSCSSGDVGAIGCFIAWSEKPDGTIKLYNQKFLRDRNEWQDILYYSLFSNDNVASNWDVDFEELTFKNNKLVKLEASKLNTPVLKVTLDTCASQRGCAHEASFYSNGKLVRIRVGDKFENNYYYDFENGVNVSLKNLDKKINEAEIVLKVNYFEEAINILNNDCKNEYPASLEQNQRIQNLLSKANQARIAYVQKEYEIRLAEERKQEAIRLAEEKEQEAIRLAEEKKQEAARLKAEQAQRKLVNQMMSKMWKEALRDKSNDLHNCRWCRRDFRGEGVYYNEFCSPKCQSEARYNKY
jgi:hypothetical protein